MEKEDKLIRRSLITDNLEGIPNHEVDLKLYESSFRRWLVEQIESGQMSFLEAKERFKLPFRFDNVYKQWQRKYSDEIVLSLRHMTAKEKTDFKAQEDRIRKLEQALEESQLIVKALNVLIDVAEKAYNLPIRKKAGAKQ